MVTSSKPSSGKKSEEKNEVKHLETEINDVITSCKSIIKNNYSVIKKKQNADKKKDSNLSKVTLETVAQDMSNILENLKTHLSSSSKQQDSFSDIVPKLEELIKTKQTPNNNANQNKNNNKQPSKINPPAVLAKQLSGKLSRKVNNNVVNTAKQNINKQMGQSRGSSASTASSRRPSAHIARQRSNISKLSIGSKRKNVSNTGVRPSSAEKKWVRPQPALSREMYDPLGVLKDEVERAKQAEKTFTIRGCFQAVRRALLSRGWVEKYHFSYRERAHEDLKKFQHYSIQELLDMSRNKELADVCKRLIKSKLLATHQVDLYWSYDYDGFKECSDKIKLTKMNKLRRDGYSYTSKKGLCDASKKSWFHVPGLASMNHPRTYNLVRNGDTSEFVRDFSLTAAMSLLKWIIKNSVTHECKVISLSGKIPLSVFNFALNECYKFIKKSRNEAITEFSEVFEQEWNEFLENYYKIVQFGNHFKQMNGITESDMVRKSNYILTHLREHWPYLDMDGIMNIWILKPINGSQGVGIHICRTLKYILGVIKSNPNRRYIVQKYIERPLLIYNTKFDIRQWFLIGSSVPLTIWIYKHSYLRFSSQTYSLRKLHESIHLTNNSVQSRYGKYQKDIALPPYNMWDSTQFKNYLSDIGYPNVFNDIIYPGMKQCITAAVLIHKDKLDRRRRCFELQGADFILTEDFKPWLLEINSSPALHASTPVTARMCPAVLEDVIKVVVDHEKNNKVNTGAFELIFDERIHGATLKNHCQVAPMVKRNYAYTHPLHDLNTVMENMPNKQADTDAAEYIKQISVGLRKTLENLLQLLKNEKQKRQFKRNKSIETISSNNIIAEIRRPSHTSEAEPVSPVIKCKENDLLSGSNVSQKFGNVTVHCPKLPKNKDISIEKDSLSISTTKTESGSSLLGSDNKFPQLNTVSIRDTNTNTCFEKQAFSNEISNLGEKSKHLTESSSNANVKLPQNHKDVTLIKTESINTVNIEFILNEIIDCVLNMSPNLEFEKGITKVYMKNNKLQYIDHSNTVLIESLKEIYNYDKEKKSEKNHEDINDLQDKSEKICRSMENLSRYNKRAKNSGFDLKELHTDRESTMNDIIGKGCEDTNKFNKINIKNIKHETTSGYSKIEKSTNVYQDITELQLIKQRDTYMDTKTTSTSSAIKNFGLLEKPQSSTLQKRANEKQATSKHQNITFPTTNKRLRIIEMVKRSLKHRFHKKKPNPT